MALPWSQNKNHINRMSFDIFSSVTNKLRNEPHRSTIKIKAEHFYFIYSFISVHYENSILFHFVCLNHIKHNGAS